MSAPETITAENFQERVLESDKPYLLDFWASWCGPCRTISPILDEICQEDTRLYVGKLDVEKYQHLAMKYHIVSIPTLLLFKNGEVVSTIVGAAPKDAIVSKLEQHLS